MEETDRRAIEMTTSRLPEVSTKRTIMGLDNLVGTNFLWVIVLSVLEAFIIWPHINFLLMGLICMVRTR